MEVVRIPLGSLDRLHAGQRSVADASGGSLSLKRWQMVWLRDWLRDHCRAKLDVNRVHPTHIPDVKPHRVLVKATSRL